MEPKELVWLLEKLKRKYPKAYRHIMALIKDFLDLK